MLRENRWLVLAIVSTALFVICIDMTVLYTALPALTYDLKATSTEKLWILNAYALIVAGFLPGMGTLGDRLGHKKMFLWGMGIFGLASLLAAFSPTPGLLVVTRGMLGVGAAIMLPATLSIIRITFSDTKERDFAMGIWGAVAAGGAAVGPAVGGFLLEYFWWGSVFLINVPIILIAMVGTILLVPKNQPNPSQSWSFSSSIIVTVGLIVTTYGLKELSHPGSFPALPLLALAGGVGILVYFVKSQKKQESPLVDFSFFKDNLFANGVKVALFANMILIGVELAITQHFQLVLDFTPLEAGLAILPIPLASLVGGPLGGLVLPRFGLHKMVIGTLSLMVIGLIIIAMTYDTGGWLNFLGLVILGFGTGASMTAASCSIMSQVPANRAGMAASLEGLSFEIGAVMGVTIFGSILTVVYTTTMVLPSEFSALQGAKDSLDGALIAAETMAPEAAKGLIAMAQASFGVAFQAVLYVATLLMSLLTISLVLPRFKAKGAKNS